MKGMRNFQQDYIILIRFNVTCHIFNRKMAANLDELIQNSLKNPVGETWVRIWYRLRVWANTRHYPALVLTEFAESLEMGENMYFSEQ